MSTATAPAPLKLASWRTPVVLIAVGCAIALIAFGPRSALGQFLTPMSFGHGWGRETFSFAIAIQNLLWGAAQPFAGAVADRFGPVRVLCAGAILYAAGLAWMAHANSIAGARPVGRRADRLWPRRLLVPDGDRRARQARAGELARVRVRRRHGGGLVRPVPVFAAGAFADRRVLLADRAAGLCRLHAAGAAAVAGAGDAARGAGRRRAKPQSSKQALGEAFGHRSYVLLVLGFFTCGFQLAFVTVHLPSYLLDRGLGADIGAWTIAFIGLFNIVGSLGSGWLSGRMPKRYLLSIIYFARALSIVAFIVLPATTTSTLIFGAVTGPAVALDRAADLGAGGADVRHALAHHAVRLCLLQPSGRRLPRRLARRPRLRATGSYDWSGGCRCSSASLPR